MMRVRIPVLALPLLMAGCADGAPKSEAELQVRLDGVGKTCKLDGTMKLRANSRRSAVIEFPSGADFKSADGKLQCLFDEVKKIPGVQLGFIGNEQYQNNQSPR
ncbi:MAG: hypothetical protein JWN66_455 [Sphingomonas bacterium]|uniref:hypothetical protein n=1 Tax=Sphingomonas bacterium TaxID=1895847 RepID=UPI00263878BD|nr:hypothetical protein [Sphingomonas bacterium]MDB5703339.1 hypothetical protein [Sphingomonas bacterium]